MTWRAPSRGFYRDLNWSDGFRDLRAQATEVRHDLATNTGAAVEWAGFAENAQHTAVASKPPQPLNRIRWRAKVDLAPHLIVDSLLIH